jgi:hypothetical protein
MPDPIGPGLAVEERLRVAELPTSTNAWTESLELSIVLLCLNEEQTVGACVTEALGFLK